MKNVVSISEKANKNYLAKIFRIENIEKHKNADRLQVTHVDYNTVITGMDAKEGDVYVYFPVDSKINKDFLSATNSFRDVTLNKDPEKKGFFEHKCRVVATKLRGEKSMGYIVPIAEIEKFVGVSDLSAHVGEYFDTINNILMVEKYVVKHKTKNGDNSNKKTKKKSKKDMLLDNAFYFHNDTEQLRRNIYKIDPHDHITISEKVHGTSCITSHTLVKRDLNIVERMLVKLKCIRFFDKIVPEVKQDKYSFVFASRKVIKGIDGGVVEDKQHFYDIDIWSVVGNELKTAIPRNVTIYSEICGYLPNGSMIQKDFDYGAVEGQHKVYVYRITVNNQDGSVINLSTKQCQEFCERAGLTFVPVYYDGEAYKMYSDISTDDEKEWRDKFIKALEKDYNEMDCPICRNKVPREGVVLRKENSYIDFEAYKLKSFRFLEKESKIEESNIEDEN